MIDNQKPFISVIMPTHNRPDVLERSIPAFIRQGYDRELYEIIVVDDGSSDPAVKAVCDRYASESPQLVYLSQPKSGPAAARNRGIKQARGTVVLIVNDDTIPDASLVQEHAAAHMAHPEETVGVLGYLTWFPGIEITPFMRWLEAGGPYFSYSSIKGEWAEWNQAWTCNLSLKKSFVLACGLFDAEFRDAAWEDIELAYRMKKKGFRLYYARQAIGYHYHPTTISSIINKMRCNGRGALLMQRKIPEPELLPPLARKNIAPMLDIIDRIVFNPIVTPIAAWLAFRMERRLVSGFLYQMLLLHYRIAGRREAVQKHV